MGRATKPVRRGSVFVFVGELQRSAVESFVVGIRDLVVV